MDRLVFLLGTGLARGAVLALFALALVLIWRGARVVNFAQGAMAVVSTYVAFEVTALTGSYWLGLLAALVSGGAARVRRRARGDAVRVAPVSPCRA